MKTKTGLAFVLLFTFIYSFAQVPQGINYMAIARDGAGEPIKNTNLPVRITIQTLSTGGSIIWQETHNALTDNFGVFSVIVGTGTRVAGLPAFTAVKWNGQDYYLKTEIKYPVTNPTYTDLGASKLNSVPYAMAADTLLGSLKKLSVTGTTTNMEEALFEVKNITGKTVFAVYNEGVRVYVDDGDAKGVKGGFAVGSQADAKGTVQNFLLVKKDTVRIYIDDSAGKGTKGGFAVGGFNSAKGSANFLNVATEPTGIINPEVNRILWYPLKSAFLTGNIKILDPADVGLNSFASGYQAKAKGQYSQSMGYLTQALGNNSTSIGKNSVASSANSFALGDGAQALMADSYAFGAGAKASGTGSYSIGSVGRDTATLLPNTQATDASGNYSFAIGLGATSTGIASTALGVNSAAGGDAAMALGVASIASGDKATALGAGQALGLYSFAAGYMSKAEGRNSVAIGYGINKPPKIVVYNHAQGDYSMALGYARAYGLSSVAIGSATANASYAYAIGHSTEVTGDYAMGFGIGLEVQSYMSTALGKYNVVAGSKTTWVATYPFFVIGNGSSPSATSNALTILKNGNVGIRVSNPGYLLQVGSAGDGSQAVAVAWNTFSDQRFKTNMTIISDPLQKILELNGYYFDWNVGIDHSKQLGVSAQEVRKVLPEIVSEGSDGYLSVDYGKLSPVIIEAIKMQQKEIEDLKSTIERLEKMIQEHK